MEMTAEKAAELREVFPPGVIGKLPKPTRREAPKGSCAECGGWHGLPAVHLDYVGHAAVTDRLLKVDPCWSWEPFAVDSDGLPLIGRDGLWIRLTICGVTRPGFGDGPTVKEMIGDAIRNAAMRFGVALDLWAKEDLHATVPEPPPPPMTVEQSDAISAHLASLDNEFAAEVKAWWKAQGLPSVKSGRLTGDQAAQVIEYLDEHTPSEEDG